MIIKNATQVGNPIIRQKSKPVQKITSVQTKRIVRDLIDSMRHHQLVGMAAPQIGLNQRIFVTEIRKTKLRKKQSLKEADVLRVFINPVIVSSSQGKVFGYEGCGSVAYAQIFGKVLRHEKLTIKAKNDLGKEFILEASGLLARVIQHEMDHLNGIVFLDRMTDTKTLMSRHEYLNKFKK
jgi:peptide deformylase